jgi:hypothetical protein
MTNVSKKKRGRDVMSTAAVSMILNGVKVKQGQKPVLVCPLTRPFTALERYTVDALSAAATERAPLRPLRQGRAEGAKGRRTLRLEKRFDVLLRDNPDLSAEEVRELKAPPSIRKMSRTTFARHWSAANERSQK